MGRLNMRRSAFGGCRQLSQLLLAGLLGVLCAYSLAAQAEQVVHYTLKNGLQLLVVPIDSAPVVLNSVWYKVGSSYETDGTTGVSHALEHLMFQGTKKYPEGKISQLVAATGGMQNAFTSRDVTVYFEKIPASFLSQVLAMEADRMQNLVITPQVFANEIQVIKEERRLRVVDNPQAVTLERFMAAAHINNPYHHPVIGWDSDLDSMQLADVRHWYQQWYRPNNAFIVVVGKVKPAQVRSLVQRYFANIPRHVLPVVKPRTEVAGLGKRQLKVIRSAKQPWFVMGYQAPSLVTLPAAKRWRAYALTLLAGVMNAGASGRLQRVLVDKDQVATDVNVGYNPHLLYSTLFTIAATPGDSVDQHVVQQEILQQVKQLKDKLVPVAELNKVKAQVVASEVYAKDSFLQRAISYGQLMALGLPWQDEALYAKRIEAITPAQVQAVAKTYFSSANLTIAQLIPQSQ